MTRCPPAGRETIWAIAMGLDVKIDRENGAMNCWINAMLCALAAGCPLPASASVPTGLSSRTPAFAQAAVVPFRIDAQALPGALQRPDQDELVRRLAESATSSAERRLARRHVTRTFVRVPSRDAVAAAPAGVIVSDTVHLPVALPPGVAGSRAAFRRGTFVTAEVTIQRPDGTIIGRGQSTLKWGEVRWTRGARVRRRARPVDEVLEDAVRKAVEHAVDDVAGRLAAVRE